MNRLLGTLFALATLAAIVFAILNIGNYSSMCSALAVESAEVVDSEQLIIYEEPADKDVIPVDSLSNETISEPIE